MSNEIQAGGWTVTFRHQRFTPEVQRKLKRSARTTCYITKKSGDRGSTFFGVAECSLKDRFSKQKGRELAFQRAIEIFPEPLSSILKLAYVNR